ncbi:hypothetical protein [Chryseobacterium luquanense]|uniref:Uncharacterized protein n=1 Tax=Chryseobacterium luquanense TaxID=2983766 RepID=A0ABT3Y9G8_9FLAO|nr:hypothetical protein [Chryseobacterium luquanense]MCX8534709.1 hypothetical protein [Chryseobacterium luquanense]
MVYNYGKGGFPIMEVKINFNQKKSNLPLWVMFQMGNVSELLVSYMNAVYQRNQIKTNQKTSNQNGYSFYFYRLKV